MSRGEPDASHLYCRLATFIDGEGSIGVSRTRTKHTMAMLRRATPRYAMSVSVINTDLRLMKWLQDNFGGSVTTRQREKPTHKVCYRWNVSDQKALVVLHKVLPFLIMKTPQAQLAIQFTEGFVGGAHLGRAKGRMVSLEEIARRDDIHEKLRVLNARGVAAAETKRGDNVLAKR